MRPRRPRVPSLPPHRPPVKTTAALLAAALLAGCSLFEAEGLNRTFLLPVIDLDVPQTTPVGRPFTVGITAQITNECITVSGTQVGREGDQLSVGVIGREQARPGQVCDVAIENVDATVEHVPMQKGELLVVAQGYTGSITATVVVE